MTLVHNGAIKVMEECGELTQAIAKKLACTPRPVHWDGSKVDRHIEEEMGDVLAAVTYAAREMGLNAERIAHRMDFKTKLYESWKNETP